MARAPETRPSLLIRLRDLQDDEAWSQFVELYAPLIYGYLRKLRLQDHDAADLTQEALSAVARSARRLEYDPRRGSFRGWLFTVVNNKLANFRAHRQRRIQGTGDTGMLEFLNQHPAATEESDALWDHACEQRLFTWAGDQVRRKVADHTWKAFWLTAVEGRDTKAVAAELAMTAAGVRLAKSRVMAQIRKLIEDVQLE